MNKAYNNIFYKKKQSFAALLDKINCYSNEDEKNELVFNCINYTVESMADYTNKEHSTIVWNCFYVNLNFKL